VSAVVRLHEQLVMVPTTHSNAYLWLAGDGVTLVDTGDPGDETIIAAALRELGLTERDLTRIVLTHFHPDHVGGAAALAGSSGAQVCAGRADAAVIRGTEAGPPWVPTAAEEPLLAAVNAIPAAAPCPVHRELDDQDLLDPAGDAVVLAVPGHTPGSVALHLPRLRAVLTGDVAIRFGDRVTLGLFNVDRARARSSLRRLAALDVDIAGVGHGTPVTSGAAAALSAATDPLPHGGARP
jgi:glyoxylase-like metal-dependent hydrolase (beta-lactamase superfamily II)